MIGFHGRPFFLFIFLFVVRQLKSVSFSFFAFRSPTAQNEEEKNVAGRGGAGRPLDG